MARVHQAVIVERTIAATPEKVFAAWTNPNLLAQWWGPPGHKVASVEVDLRVNGRYRIGIQQPGQDIYFVNGTLTHTQLPEPARAPHRQGWEGILDNLVMFLEKL